MRCWRNIHYLYNMSSTLDVKDAVSAAMSGAKEQAPRTIRRLMNYFGISMTELVEVLGVGRQTAYNRMSGSSSFRQEDLAGLAAFFEVPVAVLQGPPDDAVRYVLDHPPVNLRNRCYAMSSLQAA